MIRCSYDKQTAYGKVDICKIENGSILEINEIPYSSQSCSIYCITQRTCNKQQRSHWKMITFFHSSKECSTKNNCKTDGDPQGHG